MAGEGAGCGWANGPHQLPYAHRPVLGYLLRGRIRIDRTSRSSPAGSSIGRYLDFAAHLFAALAALVPLRSGGMAVALDGVCSLAADEEARERLGRTYNTPVPSKNFHERFRVKVWPFDLIRPRCFSRTYRFRLRQLCMRSIPSAAIAEIGDTSGAYRSDREAGGFMATCVRAEYLTVQAREDVTQPHTMSADGASKQRVISGSLRIPVNRLTACGHPSGKGILNGSVCLVMLPRGAVGPTRPVALR